MSRIRAFAWLVLLSCHEPEDLRGGTAGAAARRAGVHDYLVLMDQPNLVVAELHGDVAGMLTIAADGATISEDYAEPSATYTLTSDDTRLCFARQGLEGFCVARREGEWRATGAFLEPRDRVALARVIAVDEDFAVQGTSLVRGDYVHCTLRCELAARCAAELPSRASTCAPDMVACAGCLEVSP